MSHATVGACRSAMIFVGLNDGKLDATNQFGFQYGQVESGIWNPSHAVPDPRLQKGIGYDYAIGRSKVRV